MKNVNDLGYGKCPGCKEWKHLTRYHPKDSKKKRAQKNKYCEKCIRIVTEERTPFYELKKTIASHKTQSKEGDYAFKEVMNLLKQQGHRCAYCGKSIPYKASIDHIIPRKFGGRNLLSNVIMTCVSCNSAKQHFELFFFIRRKGYLLTEFNINRIKGAYDGHDYECDCNCEDCRGKTRENNKGCKGCKISPEKFLSGKIPEVQNGKIAAIRAEHHAVRSKPSRASVTKVGQKRTASTIDTVLRSGPRI